MNTGRESPTESAAQIYNKLKPSADSVEDAIRYLTAIERVRGTPTIMYALQKEDRAYGRRQQQ